MRKARNRLRMVSPVGKRSIPAAHASPRSRPGCAKRLARTSTRIGNAVKVVVLSICFGDRQRIGMCSRTAFTAGLAEKEMKTAIPPNGVTVRFVSRRINR